MTLGPHSTANCFPDARVRQACVLGVRLDDEDRARRVAHDGLRSTAEDETRDAGTSVRANHNQV